MRWKNTPDVINNRLDTAEQKIHELENTAMEMIQNETLWEKRKKGREGGWERESMDGGAAWYMENWGPQSGGRGYPLLWVPQMGAEKLSEEIMAGKFPNLMKIINPQIQEAQQIPSTRTTKTTTPCRITIKLFKPVKKRKPEKQPEEKDICTGTWKQISQRKQRRKGDTTKLTWKMSQNPVCGNNVYQKGKQNQDVRKLREFITSRHIWQEMLKVKSFGQTENGSRWKSGSMGRNEDRKWELSRWH